MLAALLRALFFTFYRHRAAREQYFRVLSSPRSARTIFLPFYRHRAARKQYLCRFIVAAQRGNNIFAILSSSRGAETIFLPFYRRRAARKQYLCRFIVAARRGNNIFAILSSPCNAETISLPFYRRRAARKQYFCISSFAALLRALKFLFSPLRNGDVCWRMVGAAPVCPPERLRSGVSIPKTHALCAGNG